MLATAAQAPSSTRSTGQSSAWDGRDAIVVAETLLSTRGNARPPRWRWLCCHADRSTRARIRAGLRGSYITHAYDFYKPDLTSEYPIVDGHFSIKCYTEAWTAATRPYNAVRPSCTANMRTARQMVSHAETKTPLDRFDHICFMLPLQARFQILRPPALQRLSHRSSNPIFKDVPAELRDIDYAASLSDKTIEKTFVALTKKRFAQRVQLTITLPTMCGNMYCASVYSSLCSLIAKPGQQCAAGQADRNFQLRQWPCQLLLLIKGEGQHPGDPGRSSISTADSSLEIPSSQRSTMRCATCARKPISRRIIPRKETPKA